MPVCNKCGIDKAETQFKRYGYGKPAFRVKRRPTCRKCMPTTGNKRAEARRRSRKVAKDRKNEAMRAPKDWVPCVDCGRAYPSHMMDFDHLPEHEKAFTIASKHRFISLERLLDEVAKCEVVCANCHRHRTYMRRHHPQT